ncbi:MAG: cysteine--tRNA ligase [Candidatus Nealsonbacteria bacterium]|nr:cysteine--tRNA ligase [Candidatus Nealsonbacteria bacterium]
MLKVYNTLSRDKEILKTRKRDFLELFVCGPTVYDFSHIGHARTYVAFDVIVRYLKEKGFDVFYLQNITDIDDKIIQRAKEKNMPPLKMARNFEREYFKDMKALKVNSVTKYARATDYIKEIIVQVKKLRAKSFAYQISDGVYYDIKKFKNYGELSLRTALQAEDAVSRIDDSKEKRNKGDFALWKLSRDGEPSWPSPWGPGRPGWHIEDTAISQKFFGYRYDMHGGAKDLIFPHHEAEIAQMEALSGKKPMVRYWLHTGFLTVGGQKMSKSLGNFIAIQDFLKKYSARLLRFLVLKTHYRSGLDYAESSLLQAERELARIDEFVDKLSSLRGFGLPQMSNLKISEFQTNFAEAMEDDFNTPKAMAVIFELIKQGNALIDQNLLSKTDAQNVVAFLKKIDRVFKVIFWPQKKSIPAVVLELAEEREKYRKDRNWPKADEIRERIARLGWQVEDTEAGPKLKKDMRSATL